MPTPRAWQGDKLVPREVLQAYDLTVDERVETAKSEAVAAAEAKDQSLMTDVEGKIEAATNKALSDVGDNLSNVETELKAADQTLQTNINEVSGGLTALSNVVETLPTTTDVNDAIVNALSSVYKFKGSVADYASLPTGYGQAQTGWVYNTEDTGMNYAWTGTAWDSLGGDRIITQLLTPTEYNTILNNTTVPEGAEGKLVGANAYLAMRNKIPDLMLPAGLPVLLKNSLLEVDAWQEDADGGYVLSVGGGVIPKPEGVTSQQPTVLAVTTTYVNPSWGLTLESVRHTPSSGYTSVTFKTTTKPDDNITVDVYCLSNGFSGKVLLFGAGGGVGGGSGGLEPVSDLMTGSMSNNLNYTIAFEDEGITTESGTTYLLVITGSGEGTSMIGRDYTVTVSSDGKLVSVILKGFLTSASVPFNWRLFKCSILGSSSLYVLNLAIDTRKTLPITQGGTGATDTNNAILNLTSGLSEYKRTDNGSKFPGTGLLFPMKFNRQAYNMSLASIRATLVGSVTPIVDAQTDYDTSRARAISLHTSLPTTLVNGCIYGIYS